MSTLVEQQSRHPRIPGRQRQAPRLLEIDASRLGQQPGHATAPQHFLGRPQHIRRAGGVNHQQSFDRHPKIHQAGRMEMVGQG